MSTQHFSSPYTGTELQDVAQLQCQLDAARKAAEAANAQIEALIQENQRLRETLKKERERFSALKEEKKKLEHRIESLDFKYRKHEEKLAAKNNELEKRDEIIKQQNQTIDDLRMALAYASQQIDALIEEVKRLEKEKCDLEMKLYENSTNSNKPPSSDSIFNPRRKKKSKETSPPNDADKETTSSSEDENSTADKDSEESEAEETKAEETEAAAKAKEDAQEPPKQTKREARHEGVNQQLAEEATQKIHLRPVCSCGCHEMVDQQLAYIHQWIDLLDPRLVEIIHFYVYEGTCANCGARVRAKIPEEYFRRHFGAGIHALLAWLNTAAGVSRRDLQVFCKDVLGFHISQGTIQKICNRVRLATEPYYERIGRETQRHWFNNVDETSWRTIGPWRKHLHWVWLACNQHYAYFKIQRTRSKDAFFILIGNWKGVLISDDYKVYLKWPHGRQTCLSHLIRAARKLKDHYDTKVRQAGAMIEEQLRGLCRRKGEQLTPAEIEKLHDEYLEAMEKFKDLDGETKNLLTRIDVEFQVLTYFLVRPGIEPTNNHAEQIIRSAVVLRKKMYGSASPGGEVYLGQLLSLCLTCGLQDKSYYKVLHSIMDQYFSGERPNLRELGKAHWYCENNFGKEPYAHPKMAT